MACSAFFVLAAYRRPHKKGNDEDDVAMGSASCAGPGGMVIVELASEDDVSTPSVSIVLADD